MGGGRVSVRGREGEGREGEGEWGREGEWGKGG